MMVLTSTSRPQWPPQSVYDLRSGLKLNGKNHSGKKASVVALLWEQQQHGVVVWMAMKGGLERPRACPRPPRPPRVSTASGAASRVALGLSRVTGMVVNSRVAAAALSSSIVILLGDFGGLYVLSDLSMGLQSGPQRRGIDHDSLGW